MERTSTLSAAEIVGVAAASAAALGGVIVALGRSQASSSRDQGEQAVPDSTSERSRESVERGRELARGAAASLVASYPELRVGASDLLQRVAGSAGPRASRVSSGAASTAEHVRATGATVLDRLQEDIIPSASTTIAGLLEKAGEARERTAPAASGMKTVAAAKADDALAKSTSAAKDTLATVAWTATALTLIYVVLLSPEKREQLRSFLWGAVDHVIVLARDFQGYEEEF